MNRTILTVTGVLSASSLLLVDSAVKGTVLLALAAVAALILRRDSAATRHLVWLLAIVAMLVVPVLSAMLPQWRVLPAWMSSPRPAVAEVGSPAIVRPADVAVELPQASALVEVERPSATVFQPATALPDPQPAVVTPDVAPAMAASSWNWINALPLVWVIGFAVLMLRLSAARWMLWNSERLATVIWPTARGVGFQPADDRQKTSGRLEAYPTTLDPIVIAMKAICSQLGIGRPVTLLIHPDKTIPVVWGIFRCRLMLPAAARQWSDEQLQSVLLHELAHIKRRDTIVQLLTQVACALHWFNPLVWFAAWRLDVERERACDDLVLASGIRPSAYAGHLLDVVTGLSPARWTQACGLAMARKSSLEGRLTAVLGKDLNRRGVSVALAGVALAIAVGVAVPIAMLCAAVPDKPNGEALDENAEPKDDESKALFEMWKSNARSDGTIPGGRIGEMAASLRTIIDLNPGTEAAAKCEAVLKKCDATRDWTPAEAAALLDEISVVIPSRAGSDVWANRERQIHPGKPIPGELKNAPWGQPAANGLRTAWLLEPRAEAHLLGSVMKSRVLFHNTGRGAVCFATDDWVFGDGHEATDANGEDIDVWTTGRLGISRRKIFRLAPGEYAEAEGAPVGVGSHESSSEASNDNVGGWIEAEEGDAITFTPRKLRLTFLRSWRNNKGPQNSDSALQEIIAARVMQESPMPAAAADREQLLRRVMQDLTGAAPTAQEIAAFVADNTPDALAKLTKSLQTRVGAMHFAGELAGGETKFRVTAAAANEKPKQGAAAAPAPMHKDARALYEIWQRYARANGDIPGALVGELAAAVKTFIKYNPTWETVPKLNAILPRLDATHDWKSADSIALLDEVAGVQDSPLKAAAEKATRSTIRKGEALPKKFADAPWGDAQPNGLRAAWVLEPSAAEHRIGAALKARLLVWNPGAVSVALQVPTFHQGGVKARDAKDAEVQVSGISWTTRALLVPVRLAPGEYIEIRTPGVGIGPRAGMGPWAGPRVGSNVLAKAGDELTLTHGLVPLDGSEVGVSQDDPHVSGPGWTLAHVNGPSWWLGHIKSRLNRELPLPADAVERTRLLDRAVRELFGTAPTAEETAAFVADRTPDALDALWKRLAERADVVEFIGALATAPVKFRVLDAVANANKQPRVVLGPGEYPVGEGAGTLKIVGRPVGDRRTNDAQMWFVTDESAGIPTAFSHKLNIPDGWGTWAIVCRPGEGFFYLLHKGAVRKIDYSDPRKVTDTPANDLPAEFRDEVKRQLGIHEVSAAQQAEIFEKPAPPAATPDSQAGAIEPEKEPFTAWGKEVGGLQAGLGFKAGEKRAFSHGEKVKLVVRVRNVGKEEVKFQYLRECFHEKAPTVTDGKGKPVDFRYGWLDTAIFHMPMDVILAPGKEIELSEIELLTTLLGTGKLGVQYERVLGNSTMGRITLDPILSNLATGKLELEVKEPEKLPPEKEPFTAWGKEVGGLQAGYCMTNANDIHIGGRVNAVVKLRNVSKETISVSAWPLFMSPARVVDSLDKSVRTTNEPIPSFEITPAKLTLKPGQTFDVGKANMNVVALNQDVKVPDGMVSIHTIHVEPGKYKVNCIGFVQEHSALGTGTVEFEVKAVEKPFTAWGKEVDGLQAGLGFKAGEQRVYHHGETANIVLRVRNVGKEEVEFKHIWAFFVENPPSITDADGKPVQLPKYKAQGQHGPRSPTVAPGKEVELYEWKLDLRPSAPRLGRNIKFSTLYGTGKFSVQCERIVGPTSANPNHPNSAFKDLATGKLELEVKEPAKEPSEQEPFTAWGKDVAGLQAGLGFKAGEKRVYRHGETATLVVRVRNVGQNDIKFKYYPTFLSENSPTVLDETGTRVSLRGNLLHLVKRNVPKEVNLAVGKEIELYERELRLASGNEDAGELKTRDIFPAGKFLIQHEQVIGNSAQGFDQLDPALEKLATGKLELEVKEDPAEKPKVLTPEEAIKIAGDSKRTKEFNEKMTAVEFKVEFVTKAIQVKVSGEKDARWVLGHSPEDVCLGVIVPASTVTYETRFVATLTEKAIKQFKKAGITNLEEHFNGKTIRVAGPIYRNDYWGDTKPPFEVVIVLDDISQLEVVK